ncbi:MAG: ParA family protein [Sphaerospermopsis sp. SIO1G2]|nr:ParA family protein [Sphaerospermopsis sp. SIO1G1]NET73658.1 ParA family protein [Sphaerospermopsis sp. SIO1G2]
MPAKVVSLINLKGGVAKTTTTVQLAECLASQFSKKNINLPLFLSNIYKRMGKISYTKS